MGFIVGCSHLRCIADLTRNLPATSSPELDFQIWSYNEFWGLHDAESPPTVIVLKDVACQLCRGTVQSMGLDIWITTSLTTTDL
jgi:hypothetical protein